MTSTTSRKFIAQSTVCKADDFTAPCRVVLYRLANGGLVTHIFNLQDMGFHAGHYFRSNELTRAIDDFNARCRDMEVSEE